MNTLTILYRGALETCNYACGYCPFAKRKETKQRKAEDTQGLHRFIEWVTQYAHLTFNLMFTPWGEALVFKRYQQAIQTLGALPHVQKIIFQTNLSAPLMFLDKVDCQKLKLWCTYHPSEVTLDKFIAKTRQLDAYGVSYSVGMVGDPHLFADIKALRAALNPATYLWINAYVAHNQHFAYSESQQAFLTQIDPLFGLNKPYHSLGLPCFAGESAITIDALGQVRRCHFIDEVITHIDHSNWQQALQARLCTRDCCDCHIGYMYLKSLNLSHYFGDQLLERIAL